MVRPVVLDPMDVPVAPMTKTTLILRLEGEEPPELDRYGFYDGQWVHTPRRVVLDWFGPASWWCDYRKEIIHGTSNAHRIEGVLTLGGPWPLVTTTLRHPKPEHYWSPRRFADQPVIFTVRRREDIAPGPMSKLGPRAINLEERA